MSLTALLLVVTSALYTGFQWTIRMVVYPQFARVPLAAFPAYEQQHQRLLAITVGPLFAALGGSALVVFLDPPAGASRWAVVPVVVAVGVTLAVTAFAAVPLHRRLAAGFDPSVHRRLLTVDSVRLVVAGATTVLAVVLLVR